MIRSSNPNSMMPFEQMDDDGFRSALPMNGASSPASTLSGTTPGSFANKPDIGGPLSYSSPDTPGMPTASTLTAWDFLPEGWSIEVHPEGCLGHNQGDQPVRAVPTPGFVPVTQLENARLGHVTPEMRLVAEREPHLSPEQIRDEVAAGRMIIPANVPSPRPRAMLLQRLLDEGQRQHGRIPGEFRNGAGTGEAQVG